MLTLQGEDHRVTPCQLGPCLPLPHSHIWHSVWEGGDSRGAWVLIWK